MFVLLSFREHWSRRGNKSKIKKLSINGISCAYSQPKVFDPHHSCLVDETPEAEVNRHNVQSKEKTPHDR